MLEVHDRGRCRRPSGTLLKDGRRPGSTWSGDLLGQGGRCEDDLW